jgi:hypothetical protein
MVADSRSSRCGGSYKRGNCESHSKKVDQLSCLVIERGTSLTCFVPLLFLLASLLLASLATAAETPDTSRPSFIHGLVATAQGQPVARATVELRDLRGMKMAAGLTDSAGKFAITTTAMPGEYVLLVAKELQIGDERITLDQSERPSAN